MGKRRGVMQYAAGAAIVQHIAVFTGSRQYDDAVSPLTQSGLYGICSATASQEGSVLAWAMSCW